MEHKSDSKSLIVFLCLYLVPVAGMGIDIYTPSLPHIVKYFGAHPASVKMTIAIYLLGYGIGQPIFGTLSDSWGRKWPLVVGVLIYTITSFSCGFSPNVGTLMLLRFIQGLCIAASGAITKSIMSDSFEGKELITKVTYMNICWGLGPVVAPGIGGYLQYYLGWEWNFFFLALYSGIGFLMILFFLKETNHNLVPLHPKTVISTYREILSHKIFVASAINMAIFYGMIVLFNIVGPFVIQVILEKSSIYFGHIAFIMGFAFLLGTITNRFLIRKKEACQIIPIGIFLTLLSSIAMTILAWWIGVNQYVLTVPIFIILYGCGILFPNFMAKAMSLFRHRGGAASALMGALFVSGTGIISIFGSFLKTHSLIPISLSYLGLAIIILIIYYCLVRAKPA